MKTYDSFASYIQTTTDFARTVNEEDLTTLLKLIQTTAKKKKTIFIMGNGGSASTASHLATDLAKGVFHRSGLQIKVVSLTDNVSYLSAIGNDIGYDEIFSDQLRTLGDKGDVLIGISASGNSPNLVTAVKRAKKMGIHTVAFVGFDGGKLKKICDLVIHGKTDKGAYGPAEDIHLMLTHYIVEYLVEHA